MEKLVSLKAARIILLLFASWNAKGQEAIDHLCADKFYTINDLKVALGRLRVGPDKSQCCALFTRDLVADFQEGWATVELYTPLEANGSKFSDHVYSVDFISRKDSIAFLRISEYGPGASIVLQNKRVKTVQDALSYQVDEGQFYQLEKTFADTFLQEIDPNELFNKYIVYGSSYSIDGAPTPKRLFIDSLVTAQNTKQLCLLLQATNLEMQLYAVRGYSDLLEKGYKVTPKEAMLIRRILRKKGRVNVCNGCTVTDSDVAEIAKEDFPAFR